MYSTDDQDSEAENNQYDVSSDNSRGKSKFSYTRINNKMENMIAGPYQVDFSKPYKPIFICFVDIMFGISFLVFTNLYLWDQIPYDTPFQITEILPDAIWYQIVFFFKIFFDIVYLRKFLKDGKRFMNRSKSTTKLFWFRI